MTPMEAVYRKTSAAGATGIALLIALYDSLAGDLRRAAEAERNNQLDRRSTELNHAVMVIGYLEDRISHGPGGELADQLKSLYQRLRRTILLAQARRSPELLESAMSEVLKVREALQTVELRPEASAAATQFSADPKLAFNNPSPERASLSWSA